MADCLICCIIWEKLDRMSRGKTHFVESYVAHNNTIKEVNVTENLKESYSRLAERAQKLNVDTEAAVKELGSLKEKYEGEQLLQKLIEKEIKSVKSGHFKESIVANKPRLWRFPIARINDAQHLNANRRAYTLPLWENVCNNQKDLWQGFCGLADHPGDEEEPSIKNSSIVWLDMEIDPATKLVYGVGSFVGPLGHTFEEIIDVGGKIGFSSSGFGDLMSDGFTIDPDTYEIERLADIVINPSQSVYGDASDAENPTKNSTIDYTKQQAVHESTLHEAKSKILGKVNNMSAVDAANINQAQADQPKQSIMSKVEEKAWRQYVNNFMENAESIENPTKRLAEMTDIISLFEEGIAPDLKEQFEEKLVAEKDKLEKLVESTIHASKEAGVENPEQLLEGAQRLAAEGMMMKEHIATMDEVCNSLKEKVQQLEKENQVLNTKIKFRENKIAALTKEKEKMLVENASCADKVDEQNGKIKKYIESMHTKMTELERSNQSLMESNDKLKNRVIQLREAAMNGKKTIQESTSKEAELNKKIEKLQEDAKDYESVIKQLRLTNAKLAEAVGNIKAEIENEKQLKEAERSAIVDYQPSYAQRVSGTFNFRENNGIDVENYWNTQLERYGENIKPFEAEIRGAKTLREAQTKFLKHFDDICQEMKEYNEATIVPTLNRDFNYNRLKESGMIMPEDMTTDDVNELARECRAAFGIN